MKTEKVYARFFKGRGDPKKSFFSVDSHLITQDDGKQILDLSQFFGIENWLYQNYLDKFDFEKKETTITFLERETEEGQYEKKVYLVHDRVGHLKFSVTEKPTD